MIGILKRLSKKFNQSSEAKVLAGNFLSLSILQLVGYIFPLITLPYLARVLGVEKFGVLAFATSVIAYFKTFVDFGFNYTAVRDVAIQKKNIEAISKIFSNVIVVRFLFTCISLCILLALITTIPLFRENKVILLLTFSYIPCYILFPEWFFQAMEKMKFITILNILSKLVFTILVFITIKDKEDFILQPILISLGLLTSSIISLVIIYHKFKVKFILPSLKEILYTIRNGWDMFISIFLPNFYTNFSTILLRIYGGEMATGIFDAGNKFVYVAQQLTKVLSRTFFPFLARRMDKHDLYLKFGFVLSVFMSFMLFISANFIIKVFYTPEFKDSVTVIKILSVSIIFMFLMHAFGTNYLVLINKEKTFKKIIVWCSAFGFGLSFYAIINWGFIGASITYLTVRIVLGIITWIVAIRIKKQLNYLNQEHK